MIGLLKYPDVTWRTFRVWQRNLDTFKRYYKASLAFTFGEPILYLTAMGLGVGGYISSIEGRPYLNFIAPGLLVSSAMFAACFECTWGSYTRMHPQKTYDAILATPLNLAEIVAGDILWGTTRSLITSTLMLGVIFTFGVVESPWALLIPLLAILVGFFFGSLSMIVTALAPSYDVFSYYFTLAITPLFFFSGIFFPLSRFPEWVARIAWFTPLLHGVNVSRGLVYGELHAELMLDVAWLMLGAVLQFTLAVNLVERRLIQ